MHGVEKGRLFPLRPEYSEVEMDRERFGVSAEEVEMEWLQPRRRSVAQVVVGKLKGRSYDQVQAHSQILRIRAEDSHLREDIGEGKLRLKDRFVVLNFILFSRPILPASPLSGKTAH